MTITCHPLEPNSMELQTLANLLCEAPNMGASPKQTPHRSTCGWLVKLSKPRPEQSHTLCLAVCGDDTKPEGTAQCSQFTPPPPR